MNRLYHQLFRSVAQHVNQCKPMSRLKIKSNPDSSSDSDCKEISSTVKAFTVRRASLAAQHQQHQRTNSPVYQPEYDQMYSVGCSSMLRHANTHSVRMTDSSMPIREPVFNQTPLTCQRSSISVSPLEGQTKNCLIENTLLPWQHNQQRHSYCAYQDEHSQAELSYENNGSQANVRTLILDKLSYAGDGLNSETGGISLCGGLEVGLHNIYISRVVPDSAAEKCALKAGDQILSANNVSFKGITCKRAYEILIDERQLILLVILPRELAFTPLERRHQCYAWTDVNGRAVSPLPNDLFESEKGLQPNDFCETTQQSTNLLLNAPFRRAPRLRDIHRSGVIIPTKMEMSSVRNVIITLEKGINLGLMIRGGIEYGLGIYVTRVEPGSLAENAGLMVGDQILFVNDYDFRILLHDEAVDILKSAARLSMQVRFTGKVPCSPNNQMDCSWVNWSPRQSPHRCFHKSTMYSPDINNIANYTMNPETCTIEPSGSSRLAHSQNQHWNPLIHSNSNPSGSVGHHQLSHQSLRQCHSYRGECISPHHGEDTSMNTFDKRDTPTLLITHSDSEEQTSVDLESNAEDEDELYMLTMKGSVKRPQLHNTKSEEDEQLLDEICMKYLNDKERLTLAYYRNEYETKAMSVEILVALLSELLDTEQKYMVVYNLYHIIRSEDVDRFDKLIHKREEHSILRKNVQLEAGKYKQFFIKQNSFDCPSNDDTVSAFENLTLSESSVHGSMQPLQTVAMDSHQYECSNFELPSSLDSGHYQEQIDVQCSLLQSKNRLSHSECPIRRPSSTQLTRKSPIPNSVAYRKTFMTRRHSSGTSETTVVRETSPHRPCNTGLKSLSAFGSYPLVTDERRWSIAAAECRRPSTLFFHHDHRRSPSPVNAAFGRTSEQRSREEINSQHMLCGKNSRSSFCQETIPESENIQLTPDSPNSSMPSASGPLRGSGNHLHVPNLTDTGSDTEENQHSNHLRVRRHRSLPSPTFSTDQLVTADIPQQQRSSSFRLPSHRAIAEPEGRWRIKVKKTKQFLGIAIEGGANVSTQTQPRIISIHNAGAAVECGDLHVGHIILEIDGQSTASMDHEHVAQRISRAYYNTPEKDYVEFLVREKSRKEFDLRRSSFMLLNNSFE